MVITSKLAIAVGLGTLAACNNSPQEQKADNIEKAAENQADSLEDAAGYASNEATKDALDTKADRAREQGERNADATRTSADLDGNSAN